MWCRGLVYACFSWDRSELSPWLPSHGTTYATSRIPLLCCLPPPPPPPMLLTYTNVDPPPPPACKRGRPASVGVQCWWCRTVGRVFFLQEVWAFEPLKLAMLSMYRVAYSVHEGTGTRHAAGWRGALEVPNMALAVIHDSTQMYDVVLELSIFGRVVAVSPHISPSHQCAQYKEVPQQMCALAYVVSAAVEVIVGYFNMAQDSPQDALMGALRPTGALGTFAPIFPLGTITDFTYDKGVRRCTSTDHILPRRHTRIVEAVVLPSRPPTACYLL